MSDHTEDDLKRQRSYNGDQLYSNVSRFIILFYLLCVYINILFILIDIEFLILILVVVE